MTLRGLALEETALPLSLRADAVPHFLQVIRTALPRTESGKAAMEEHRGHRTRIDMNHTSNRGPGTSASMADVFSGLGATLLG